MKRNAAVDKELSTEGFEFDDVAADGNWYFRALSLGLNGMEINHANLV